MAKRSEFRSSLEDHLLGGSSSKVGVAHVASQHLETVKFREEHRKPKGTERNNARVVGLPVTGSQVAAGDEASLVSATLLVVVGHMAADFLAAFGSRSILGHAERGEGLEAVDLLKFKLLGSTSAFGVELHMADFEAASCSSSRR